MTAPMQTGHQVIFMSVYHLPDPLLALKRFFATIIFPISTPLEIG
jgi:hypothetical protein